jgi:Protein of unknown function DUF47
MLRRQAAVTVEGMAALVAWAGGEPEAAQRVRDCEHRADDTKRELRRALTVAFMTPIDAEDLYVMSERLDAVLNGAKDAVREAEVMAVEPDQAVAAMAALLADGVGHPAKAFQRLDPRQPEQERGQRDRCRRRRREDPAAARAGLPPGGIGATGGARPPGGHGQARVVPACLAQQRDPDRGRRPCLVRHREGGLSHRGQRGTHTVPSR